MSPFIHTICRVYRMCGLPNKLLVRTAHDCESGLLSGFGIFKQNRDNPDEIGMVGQSACPVCMLHTSTLIPLITDHVV